MSFTQATTADKPATEGLSAIVGPVLQDGLKIRPRIHLDMEAMSLRSLGADVFH